MTQLHVAVICTGNICRSPMGEVALKHLLGASSDLSARIRVTSAGTARWHEGSSMDPRARRALDRAGFVEHGSRAAYADSTYLDRQDLVLVMTREHRADVLARLTNPCTEVVMVRNLLQPGLDLDVADPYYGTDDDFDACLTVLTEAGRRLLGRWNADQTPMHAPEGQLDG
ncbi:MAG: low molecular weight protein-tyrosine-phosphatase [Acidimicrobiales bacterium]